jgi:hypothetical protein
LLTYRELLLQEIIGPAQQGDRVVEVGGLT